MSQRSRLLAGWGGTAPSCAEVLEPLTVEDVQDAVARFDGGVIARGLGRSYGDCAQNAGGTVLDMTRLEGLLDPIGPDGRVTALAGTSLGAVLEVAVPAGWFVPVSPGTRHVTIGGAIACDVHGKNHHHQGSFGNFVERLDIVTPAGGHLSLTPEGEPDLFWATVGGMGLTGVIISATLRLVPVPSSRMIVDIDRAANLEQCLSMLLSTDAGY